MPKTGGTSIRKALAQAPTRPRLGEGARAPHARAREHIEALGPAQWDDTLTFALVRDPYARLVSCWAYAFGTGAPSIERFRSWVDGGCPLNPRYRLAVGRGRLVWMHAPQVEWLEGPCGGLAVSRILRLERLAREWPAVAWRIGAPADIPWENRSDHHPIAAYYDEATREQVAARYARDFERLDYPI